MPLTTLLILITVIISLLFVLYVYIERIPGHSLELIDFGNEIGSAAISYSFMVGQMFSSKYRQTLATFLNNIQHTRQSHIMVSLRLKSLGADTREQYRVFWQILTYIQTKRQITPDKRITVVIAGLFGQYSDLEFKWFMESIDRGVPDVMLTLQSNHRETETKVRQILEKTRNLPSFGAIRLVKGYYKSNIVDKHQIHANYLKLARILVQSGGNHMLATHNLQKIADLYHEFPNMPNHIQLGYFYYIDKYFQTQLNAHPELRVFNAIPQVQMSDVTPALAAIYSLDALAYWDVCLMFNLMIKNKLFAYSS